MAGQPAATPELDYQLVAELATLVSERVTEQLRAQQVSNAEQRRTTEEVARRLVREHVDNRVQAGEFLPRGVEETLTAGVIAYLLGLGPRLQPIIDDPDVENVYINGFDRVRVEYADGRVDETSFTAAADDDELIRILQRAAARGGQTERTLSTSKPILHLRLPDGSRMTAIHVVTSRPVIAIRRHRIRRVSLRDMVVRGSMTDTLAAFVTGAVRGNLNIMIAGLPNAGKSTLLRAIASVIPADEWFASMETVYELGLHETGLHPWAVAFEEREGHGEIGPNGRPQGSP